MDTIYNPKVVILVNWSLLTGRAGWFVSPNPLRSCLFDSFFLKGQVLFQKYCSVAEASAYQSHAQSLTTRITHADPLSEKELLLLIVNVSKIFNHQYMFLILLIIIHKHFFTDKRNKSVIRTAWVLFSFIRTIKNQSYLVSVRKKEGHAWPLSLCVFCTRSDHSADHDHSDDGSPDVTAQCQLLHQGHWRLFGNLL